MGGIVVIGGMKGWVAWVMTGGGVWGGVAVGEGWLGEVECTEVSLEQVGEIVSQIGTTSITSWRCLHSGLWRI